MGLLGQWTGAEERGHPQNVGPGAMLGVGRAFPRTALCREENAGTPAPHQGSCSVGSRTCSSPALCHPP